MATPILELQRAMGAASGNEGPWVHFVDEHGAVVSEDTDVTAGPCRDWDGYDDDLEEEPVPDPVQRMLADIEAFCGPREGYP